MHQFWGVGKEISVLSLITVDHKIALLSMQACGIAECFLLTSRAIVCCPSPGCGLVVLDPFRKIQFLDPEIEKFSLYFA